MAYFDIGIWRRRLGIVRELPDFAAVLSSRGSCARAFTLVEEKCDGTWYIALAAWHPPADHNLAYAFLALRETMVVSQNTVTTDTPIESSSSAVSWASIIAGGLAAAAISLVLLLIGTGLGFTMVSPWQSQSASMATIGVAAAVWLVIVQWLSAGLGGYLTGRLRTKWVGVHTHEVSFRDTAHGFLAWALSTLLVAGLLSSSVSAIIGAGIQATASTAGAATTVVADKASDLSTSYFTDALIRPANPVSPATTPAVNPQITAAQISRILAYAAIQGKMSDEDRAYIDRAVASQTGMSEADAKKRVDSVLKQVDDAKLAAQQATDKARKAASAASLLGALTLFIGAFIAAVAAAYGGRQRDEDEELRVG